MENKSLQDFYVDEQLLKINANFLAIDGEKLKKKAWLIDRGLRVKQSYVLESNNSEEIVREIYSYNYKNDGRLVESYSRTIEWLSQGEVFLTQETTPDLTVTHMTEVNKSARNGQVNYLELAADQLKSLAETLPEPYRTHYITVGSSIDLLLTHYEASIRKYKERNLLTLDFENALLNETDETISSKFDLTVRQPDAKFPKGLNLLQAIMYQLKGLIP